MTEKYKSRNGRRDATIEPSRYPAGTYLITLNERKRYYESTRECRVSTKKEATAVAKDWVR